MHAGYLGGVWAAVKAGMGAGLAALLVGLQPVLTAFWISARAEYNRYHAKFFSRDLAFNFGTTLNAPGAAAASRAAAAPVRE